MDKERMDEAMAFVQRISQLRDCIQTMARLIEAGDLQRAMELGSDILLLDEMRNKGPRE